MVFLVLMGTGRHVYKNIANKFYLDDVLIYTCPSTTFTAPGSLPLFAIKTGDNSYDTRKMIGKLYSCKIWKNNILVRDLIPVRKLDNTVCMYDKISTEYFENRGIGRIHSWRR